MERTCETYPIDLLGIGLCYTVSVKIQNFVLSVNDVTPILLYRFSTFCPQKSFLFLFAYYLISFLSAVYQVFISTFVGTFYAGLQSNLDKQQKDMLNVHLNKEMVWNWRWINTENVHQEILQGIRASVLSVNSIIILNEYISYIGLIHLGLWYTKGTNLIFQMTCFVNNWLMFLCTVALEKMYWRDSS